MTSPSSHDFTLLVVDDDSIDRGTVSAIATDSGRRIVQAKNYSDARSILSQNAIDLVLVDLKLDAANLDDEGLMLMTDLEKKYCNYIVISEYVAGPREKMLWGWHEYSGLCNVFDKGRSRRKLNSAAGQDDLRQMINTAVETVLAQRKADGLSQKQLELIKQLPTSGSDKL